MIISLLLLMQPVSAPTNAVEPIPVWTATHERNLAEWLPEARKQLDAKMIDYPRARFKGVTVRMIDGLPVWCGEINAPNAVGGFIGWRPFAFEFIFGFIDDPRTRQRTCDRMTVASSPIDRSASLAWRR